MAALAGADGGGGAKGVLLQAPKNRARLAARAAGLLLITEISFEQRSS